MKPTVKPGQQTLSAIITRKSRTNVVGPKQGPSEEVQPSWTSTPAPPDATVGVAYSYNLAQHLNTTKGVVITVAAGSLPAGLTIQGFNIAGTPTADGTQSGITLTATNSVGNDTSSAFAMTVNQNTQPATIPEGRIDNPIITGKGVLDRGVEKRSEAPPPPMPADHIIPATAIGVTTTWNGQSNGVQPGDIIEIEGGTRGPIRIDNVVGTAANPVIIRSDITQRTIITRASKNGDFLLRLKNCEHFILDGSYTPGETYGLLVTSTQNNDNPGAYIQANGTTTKYTVRYVEVDGKYLTLSDNGIGFQQNDNNVTTITHPGLWREDVILEHMYVHDVQGEGIYAGPNYRMSGQDLNQIPLRNITVRNNLVERCGRDGINIKSTIEGTNDCYGNVVIDSGIRPIGDESSGGQKDGIAIFEGTMNIYNNYVENSGESGIKLQGFYRPNTFGPWTPEIYNNQVVNSGVSNDPVAQTGIGIACTAASGTCENRGNVYNNTIVDSEGHGVQFTNTIASGNIRDNIVVDNGWSDINGQNATVTNNQTGASGPQNFVNAGARDYRLTSSSPARNNAVGPAPSDDLDGTTRPQEGTPDQGCFEYVP